MTWQQIRLQVLVLVLVLLLVLIQIQTQTLVQAQGDAMDRLLKCGVTEPISATQEMLDCARNAMNATTNITQNK